MALQMTSMTSAPVLLLLALGLLSNAALALKTRTHSHAELRLKHFSRLARKLEKLEHTVRQSPDVAQLVAGIDEVNGGFAEEDAEAKALQDQRRKATMRQRGVLELAIAKAERARDLANQSLISAVAMKGELESRMVEVKECITNGYNNIDGLEITLKASRDAQAAEYESTSNVTLLLQAAIDRAKSENRKRQMGLPNNLRGEVSYLEKLGDRLSASFVQIRSTRKRGSTPRDVLVLTSEKEEVESMRRNMTGNLDQEDSDILALIEEERKKIAACEKEMDELQVALVDIMKRIGELQLQLNGAVNSLARDTQMLDQLEETWNTTSTYAASLDGTRNDVMNDIKTAKPLIQHMSLSALLTTDIKSLAKSPPAFLQMHSKAFTSTDDSSSDTDDDKDAAFLQRQDMLAAMARASGHAKASGTASGSSLQDPANASAALPTAAPAPTDGPFDMVTQMIESLITNIREQMNEDIQQDQFCRDQAAANQAERKQARDEMSNFATAAQLAKDAVEQLEAQLKFVDSEIERLTESVDTLKKEKADEVARLDADAQGHNTASSVLSNSVVILQQLCNLPAGGAAPASGVSTDCQEAATLLSNSVTGVGSLNSVGTQYKNEYVAMMDEQISTAEGALTAKNNEKGTLSTQLATRKSEQIEAKESLKNKKTQLKTIEKAGATLESDCSHQESHEEKQARRKDEIDALKEALRVLDGEAVPTMGGGLR